MRRARSFDGRKLYLGCDQGHQWAVEVRWVRRLLVEKLLSEHREELKVLLHYVKCPNLG